MTALDQMGVVVAPRFFEERIVSIRSAMVSFQFVICISMSVCDLFYLVI